MDRMVTGQELKERREARGWSREEFARLLGYKAVLTGVRAISRWESGETKNPHSKQYHEAVRILTGVEQASLADVAERLGHVESAVAELLAMIRVQQETLHGGQWVVKLDRGQLRELMEVLHSPPSERLLKRADYAH